MTLRRAWPVLLLAAVMSVAHVVATPAFWPVDETSHVAYADHLVTEGALPRIDDPIPATLDYPGLSERLGWERLQLRYGRQDIWTANHPPLAYAVQGVALRAGDAVAGPSTALVFARLTSTAWLVVGVWASMQLAFLLTPSRRDRRRMTPSEVAYAVGTLVAVVPTLSHLSGLVFNDVPAFALSTLVLHHGARAAYGGLTPHRLVVGGLIAGLAGMSRVTALPAVGIAVALALYGWWRDPEPMRVPGRMRAVALAAAACVPAAAFWLRNVVRYGDPTASGYLLEKFNRDLNSPVTDLVGDRFFWLKLWDRMLGDLTTGHWAVGTRAHITEGLLLVVLAGVAWWAATRFFVQRPTGRRDGEARDGDERDGDEIVLDAPDGGPLAHASHLLSVHPSRVVWTGCAAFVLTLLGSMITFHADGGSLHGRYLMGGMAIIATVMVLALDSLPRIGRQLAIAAALPLFVVNASLVQALNIHQSGTWSRIDIDLVLPLLAGPVTTQITMACSTAGVILLGIIMAQHRRRRWAVTEATDTATDRRQAVVPPSRSSKESAAL